MVLLPTRAPEPNAASPVAYTPSTSASVAPCRPWQRAHSRRESCNRRTGSQIRRAEHQGATWQSFLRPTGFQSQNPNTSPGTISVSEKITPPTTFQELIVYDTHLFSCSLLKMP